MSRVDTLGHAGPLSSHPASGSSADPGARFSAAQAINRVLLAEHEAAGSIAQAELQGHEAVELARQDALTVVNRGMERIAAWQLAHAAALQIRLETLRAQATSSAAVRLATDGATLDGAVGRLAALLTGGAAAEDANDASR